MMCMMKMQSFSQFQVDSFLHPIMPVLTGIHYYYDDYSLKTIFISSHPVFNIFLGVRTDSHTVEFCMTITLARISSPLNVGSHNFGTALVLP